MAERVRLRPSSPPPQPSFGGLKQWRCVRPCPSSPPPQPSFGGLKQWRSVYAHAPPQPSFGGAWCYAALCIRPRPSSSAVVWWFETMAERSTYAPPPRPLLNRCLAEQGATLHSVYARAPPPPQSFGGLKQWQNGPPTPLLPAPPPRPSSLPLLPAPPQPLFGGAGCYAVLCTPALEALSTFSTYVHSHLRGVASWSLCSVYAHASPPLPRPPSPPISRALNVVYMPF